MNNVNSPGKSSLMMRFFCLFYLKLFLVHCGIAQDLDVPYVPTPPDVVEQMLEVTNIGPGDYVIDLGSGDGRIVIAAARRGAVGHGVDLNPVRVEEAERNAAAAGVSDRAMFLVEDIFETDYSRATVITMYLLGSVNRKLRPELLSNLRPGTRVVSHAFDMGEWEPDEHIQVEHRNVYYWVVPAAVEGQWEWNTGDREFILNAEQDYQNISLNLTSGGEALQINEAELNGDRINFIASGSNNNRYVFNGRIDEGSITGTIQIRENDVREIRNWTATLN